VCDGVFLGTTIVLGLGMLLRGPASLRVFSTL
jgi:hypothetical protein